MRTATVPNVAGRTTLFGWDVMTAGSDSGGDTPGGQVPWDFTTCKTTSKSAAVAVVTTSSLEGWTVFWNDARDDGPHEVASYRHGGLPTAVARVVPQPLLEL